jgi:nucleotide-binding universal stress UspA family protein
MYKKILVALENSSADQCLLPHISELAQFHQSHLLLVHVADGWVARHYNELLLNESEEMIKDRQYLEEAANSLKEKGLQVSTYLALGEPSQEILDVAKKEHCDLIAMTSHGHRFLADIFYGSTIEEVRHQSSIPLLIVKWIQR